MTSWTTQEDLLNQPSLRLNRADLVPIQTLIDRAVDSGIANYLETRKIKVPASIAKQIPFEVSTKLRPGQRGKDIYRTTLILLWLLPLSAARISAPERFL